jgi:hypothetical protein
MRESGAEFKNYVFYRYLIAEEHYYDYGLDHWNLLVFNYVPAQIVGRDFKESLMLKLHPDFETAAKTKYGHVYTISTTSTGFVDPFASFGWFGFVKFLIIGWLMGVLYRHAMQGAFLGQLLYIYMLGTAMHVISHGTHRILFSAWVYFFMMGFSVLFWARANRRELQEAAWEELPDADGSVEA